MRCPMMAMRIMAKVYLVITMCIYAICKFAYLNTMTTYVAGNYYHQHPNFTGKKMKALGS